MVLTKRFGILTSILTIVLLVGLFAIPATPARAQGRQASISITPSSVPQDSLVLISLSGYAPGEPVTLWQTFPDYTVLYQGDFFVDDAGFIDLLFFTDSRFNPTGTHWMSARGNLSGRLGIARFTVTLGTGAPADPSVRVTVEERTLPQGFCFTFFGEGFAPREAISTWFRRPDNSILDTGDFFASSAGSFEDSICFSNLAAEGRWYYTAYGNSSGLTGIVDFNLVRGDYLEVPTSDATLEIIPSSAQQLDFITVIGTGFHPFEVVSFWITLPNGVVLPLGEGVTVDGTFEFDLFVTYFRPDTGRYELPVGRSYVSAFGNFSFKRAVAPLDILPGTGG